MMKNDAQETNGSGKLTISELTEIYFDGLKNNTLDDMLPGSRPDVTDFEKNYSCQKLLRMFREADPEYRKPRTISYLSSLAMRSLRLLRISSAYILKASSPGGVDLGEKNLMYKLAAGEGLLPQFRAALGEETGNDAIKDVRKYILMQHAWKAVKDELAMGGESSAPVSIIPSAVLSLYKEPWFRCDGSLNVATDEKSLRLLKRIMAARGFTAAKADPLETERARSFVFRNEDDIEFRFFRSVPFSLPGDCGTYMEELFGELIREGREMTSAEYTSMLILKLHSPNILPSSACLLDLLDLALIMNSVQGLPGDACIQEKIRGLVPEERLRVIFSVCGKVLPSLHEPSLEDDELKFLIELIGRPYLRARYLERLSEMLLYLGSYYDQPEYTVSSDKRLVYLVNSKAACSSIKATFLDKEACDDYSAHIDVYRQDMKRYDLTDDERDYFKFTFVRNPFSRLVSCYESKYHADRERYKYKFDYRNYLYGYLYYDEGFDEFVRKVCALPYRLMDRHFRSQYDLIFDASGETFDYIGHFESLAEDFSVIQNKYRLRPLPHLNRVGTDDWMNYYTPETADLVYRTFRKDIEAFGYGNSYSELLLFIRSRAR